MPQFTEHLNLTKPAEDEFYNIAVPNSNMEILDESIRALAEENRALREELAGKADIESPQEYDFPLEDGLTNIYGRDTYSKDYSGRVFLQFNMGTEEPDGFIRGRTLIGTLPVGYRPAYRHHNTAFVRKTVSSYDKVLPGIIFVDTNGNTYLDVYEEAGGVCHATINFLAVQ